MERHPLLKTLEGLEFEDLQQIVSQAHDLLEERRRELRRNLQKQADCLGLRVTDPGKKPRGRKAKEPQQDDRAEPDAISDQSTRLLSSPIT